MIDSTFITNTLIDLVKINSVNPNLEKGGMGEIEIGNYIHQVLQSCGFATSMDQFAPGRANVIGKWNGTGNGKSLILNAHMDTVGVEGMIDAFSPKVVDGKLFGRGAYDMKGSIAAMLGVAKAIAESRDALLGDVHLTFVADEEYESVGTQQLLRNVKADACIVTEPTELQICLGHRGFGIYEIITHGKIAHGGQHHVGIDANLQMGLVLNELSALSKSLTYRKKHPLCGDASLHVPLIKGGQSLFIYAGQCSIQVERRTLPGEKEKQVYDEINEILEKLGAVDPKFKSSIKQLIWRNPYEISSEAAIVKSLQQAMQNSRSHNFIGHTWWEDAALFGEAGIETVIIGPKGGGIHQQKEWVDLSSVHDLSAVLLQTTLDFCNQR